jgi:hypothetical protein
MLPQIREQIRHAFRNEQPERREDLLAEVIANGCVAFVRLMDRGLADVISAVRRAYFSRLSEEPYGLGQMCSRLIITRAWPEGFGRR